MNQPCVLFVDDDLPGLFSLTRALKASGLLTNIETAATADAAISACERYRPAVAVIDLGLDESGPEAGFALIRDLLALDTTCRIIVLTGHSGISCGIRALSLGAAHFVEKPAEPNHLLALIRDGFHQASLRREVERLRRIGREEVAMLMVGMSAQMNAVIDAVHYASQTNQPVLITGETGTGKGVCALAIHRTSQRRARRFVRYQPSFGSADLVNSDLFGHVRGAFTGAHDERRGLIAEAEHGTLFLDEVAELPMSTQIVLLGVLQDRRYRALGSTRELEADFRLICATNHELASSPEKLRSDFFHRIAHFRIELPPLRQRLEDIDVLAHAALRKLHERENIAVFQVSPETIAELQSYNWPGNVRELEAVIESCAYRAQVTGRSTILPSDVALRSSHQITTPTSELNCRLEMYRRNLIEAALIKNGGNKSLTARELGIDRATLRRVMGRRAGKEERI